MVNIKNLILNEKYYKVLNINIQKIEQIIKQQKNINRDQINLQKEQNILISIVRSSTKTALDSYNNSFYQKISEQQITTFSDHQNIIIKNQIKKPITDKIIKQLTKYKFSFNKQFSQSKMINSSFLYNQSVNVNNSSLVNNNMDQKYAQQLQQAFNINQFKSKFIFKPFQYQQALQQTLTYPLHSFNPIQINLPSNNPSNNQSSNVGNTNSYHHHNKDSYRYNKESINIQFQLSNKSNNVHFGINNPDSFNSTSKSIKTNKTIFTTSDKNYNQSNLLISNKPSPLNQVLNKSTLLKPPNLLMKKTISITTNKSQFIPQQNQLISSNQSNQKSIAFFNGRTNKKQTLFNKQKYQETQKSKIHHNNSSSLNSSQHTNPPFNKYAHSITQGQSLCQSIALDSLLVQNFLKNTFQSGFFSQMLNSTSQALKNSPFQPQPLSFYSFCMLLFPQTGKSMPCPVFVIDTLFYVTTTESKDIIYVFKDKRRNMLIKMKNKNKSAYELFLKRRQIYEINKAKQDKLKKMGIYKKNKKNKLQNSTQLQNSRLYNKPSQQPKTNNKNKQLITKQSRKWQQQQQQKNRCSIIQQEDSQYMDYQDSIYKQQSVQYEQLNEKYLQLHKSQSVQFSQNYQYEEIIKNRKVQISDIEEKQQENQLKRRLSNLSFKCSYKTFITQNQNNKTPQSKQNNFKLELSSQMQKNIQQPSQSMILTPSNSLRQSYHTIQTNYMSLLKYNNNTIIRLKLNQFKSIFNNPLYANQRFKNNNNTQYIQALPIQQQFNDINIYSIHFHYEIFKNEELFTYVKNSLYKENQYININSNKYYEDIDGNGNIGKDNKMYYGFDNMSIEKKRNVLLKQKLKQQSIDVYLYYQIFEIYTYISMHYNKQILNGIFRFIQYDNDFALFQTENLLIKDMPKQAEFIKTKIFNQQSNNTHKQHEYEFLKLKNKNISNCSTIGSIQTPFQSYSGIDTPTQTIKNINKQILKLSNQTNQNQSQLQKQIYNYFNSQNKKIQKQMTTYFNQKIQKIKNIKDMNLSKNIFQIINQNQFTNHQTSSNCQVNNLFNSQELISKQQKFHKLKDPENKAEVDNQIDFHEILNDDKKLQKFIKLKQSNDVYSRKNISNFSVVRWKQQVKKIKQRKSATIKQNYTCFQRNQPSSTQVKQKVRQERPFTAKSINNMNNEQKLMMLKSNKNGINSCSRLKYNQFKEDNLIYSVEEQEKRIYSNQKSNFNNLQRQFEKKLINQKYTQWNKSKFKLTGYKTDKFI